MEDQTTKGPPWPFRRTAAKRKRWRAATLLGVPAVALVLAQIVVAAPPTANFTMNGSSAQSLTVNVGNDVALASTSTDPDEDIAALEWDFDYDGETFTADATGDSATRPSDAEGSFIVALRVTDTDAVDGAAQMSTRLRTLNVQVPPSPNQAPTAAIACTPGEVNPNATVTCSSAGSFDPDGAVSEYEWAVNTGQFTEGGASFQTSFAVGGTHTIRLRVRDNNGTLSPAVSDTVSVNGPPSASITRTVGALPALPPETTVDPQLNQNAPLLGQIVQFSSAGSTDPGGAIASRAWDVDVDGVIDGSDVTYDHTFTTPGTKNVQLTVTDAGGASGIATSTFRVNSLPEPAFVPDNPTPVINQSVGFFSASSDPDNDITAYAWDFDNDGQFGEAQTGEIECQGQQSAFASCEFASADTYSVALRVTDAGGVSRIARRQVLIQSTVPRGSFTFSSESPLPGQPVTFSSTSTPSPNKQLTGYEWDFNYDGVTFTPDAAGQSVTHGFSSAGPRTVALKVHEAMPGGGPATGGYAIVSRTITVNAPPTAGMQISPPNPFVRDSFTISSTATDPDGPITAHHWDLDNDGQFDDASGPVISASYRSAGHRTVRLQVTDSKGAVATAFGTVDVRTRPAVAFPVFKVQIGVAYSRSFTDVKRLKVRAPAGTTVTVRCKGKRKGCPKRTVQKSRSKGRFIRFKALERRLKPGAKLIITGTKAGFIGEQTTYTIRPGKEPKRVDRCLMSGAKKAIRCP